jgi:hypothetical protein
MMKRTHIAAMSILLLPPLAAANPVDLMLQEYRQQGASGFDAQRGRTMWSQEFVDAETHLERSCETCHSANLAQSGRHAKTNKIIEPLAPSANPERLTDTRQMKKWLKRNCKWTLGRECTPQEKGDFLVYLRTQ